ncbi:MAG: Na(+)-translocating NADH-quinone reductase subunit A [Calditrichaeota bacterium]|nr:MAG: Na(+)-translocating NADH-quinone reductase subunit A [Calditrichota bacterium]MBL1206838.1 Na(+)-translocating NADH-quinone reductase subunit A [Calditrichota bacterium]NOG46665.1 Na(+)-translocating NADH-quinone reductase subunit A [Calditrichota bacterium]
MAEFKLKKGFDIKVAGKADLELTDLGAPKKVALQPTDFRGYKPKLEVEVGSQVKKGSPLFHLKSNEAIKFVSPVSGKVVEINRGERRAIVEVVVENDSKDEALKFDTFSDSTTKEQIIDTMSKGGMWPLVRQRPFSKIANPADTPRDIFISGMDTAPLAADMKFIMQGLEKDFQLGVNIISKLTEGKIYLSTESGAEGIPAFQNVINVEKNTFSGPHPAGNVGVQIHHIKPVKRDIVWYVQPYAVAMIGQFFRTGEYASERIVAIAGHALKKKQYFKTILGVPVASLITEANLAHPDCRLISGNVLTGRKVLHKGYVGYYDNLISVIPEGPKERRLIGWYRPGFNLRSHSKSFLSTWVNRDENEVDTLLNGGDRTFVMSGDYENVLPMDVYPVYLAKSIMAEDIEEMEGLGILEVDEEDLALCSYICPSKNDFGKIVRQGLDLIEKEG